MNLPTATIPCLLFAVLSSTSVLAEDKPAAPRDLHCTWYTDANTTSASCNGYPGRVCTGGCTDFITATQCSTSNGMNDPKPPLTTEKCTISYGRSSATMAICITEHQTFTCYGPPSGKASCKGCIEHGTSGPGNDGKGNGTATGNNAGGDKPAPGGGSQTDKNPPPQNNPTTGNTNTPPTTSSPPNGNTDSSNPDTSPKGSASALVGWSGLSLAVATLVSGALFL